MPLDIPDGYYATERHCMECEDGEYVSNFEEAYCPACDHQLYEPMEDTSDRHYPYHRDWSEPDRYENSGNVRLYGGFEFAYYEGEYSI